MISILMLITSSIFAQDLNKLKLFGDVRFRTELDRNSKKKDGSFRNDRDRLRYRIRFGFKYNLNKNFEFGARIRSGNPFNQQSPHITIGNEFHSGDFSVDKVYIKVKDKSGLWLWAGKNGMPFWEQNEMLWDGDVNPEGLASGGKFNINDNMHIMPVLGYFIENRSGKSFIDDSRILAAQVRLSNKFNDNKLVLSTGFINANKIPEKPDYVDTFTKNYSIWASSLQFNLKSVGLTLGVDYFKNLADYKNNENVADIFKDQTTGYVTSIKYGLGKFQFGYYFAHIEKYAVIDYFAQDDWVRWGNKNYTRSSNYGGHEFRVKYKIAKNFNTVFRAYFVEGLKIIPGGTDLETGTRIRLDFNIKF